MAHPAVRGASKILLDWTENASVLAVASLPVPLITKSFQVFAYFKELEFLLIMRVSESGLEVSFGEVSAADCRSLPKCVLQARFWITSALPTIQELVADQSIGGGPLKCGPSRTTPSL